MIHSRTRSCKKRDSEAGVLACGIWTALVLAFTITGGMALAEEASGAVDTGTDPTKLSNQFETKYEYLDLNGVSSNVLRLGYTMAFGTRRDYSLKFTLPVVSVDALGNDDFGVGDVSAKLTHVFGVTRKGGYVVQGELVLDTADRPELGTGQDVFKGTFIWANFLKSGSIFAPAVVHSVDLSNNAGRADVNTTTFDFYYVPKLRDPRNLMTVDPALVFDREADTSYASLQVTAGRVVGKAMRGALIAFVKPSLFAGADRPGDWGLEVGLKVIGF